MAKKSTSTIGVKAELKNSLLLHRFMLKLLGVRQLDKLTQMLSGSDSEGYDEDGGTKFCTLLSNLIDDGSVSRSTSCRSMTATSCATRRR